LQVWTRYYFSTLSQLPYERVERPTLKSKAVYCENGVTLDKVLDTEPYPLFVRFGYSPRY